MPRISDKIIHDMLEEEAEAARQDSYEEDHEDYSHYLCDDRWEDLADRYDDIEECEPYDPYDCYELYDYYESDYDYGL